MDLVHRRKLRGLEHLFNEGRLRELRLFSLENAPGSPYSSFPVPKGGLEESWRGTLYQGVQQ